MLHVLSSIPVAPLTSSVGVCEVFVLEVCAWENDCFEPTPGAHPFAFSVARKRKPTSIASGSARLGITCDQIPIRHHSVSASPFHLVPCNVEYSCARKMNWIIQPVEHQRSAEVPLSHAVIQTSVDDAVIIWTDGARPQNQCRAIRRAGCGLFYGRDHPRNKSFALHGPDQTNNRAELLACIVALEGESRPVQIGTDCQYDIDGFLDRRRKSDNEDLWNVMQKPSLTAGIALIPFSKSEGMLRTSMFVPA